jgi:hypothetical protein
MLAYLDEACARRQKAETLRTLSDLIETVQEGALVRIRAVSMTSLANILGLMPVMWATGTGANVMKRIAAPMVGGVFTAMLLTLRGHSGDLCDVEVAEGAICTVMARIGAIEGSTVIVAIFNSSMA